MLRFWQKLFGGKPIRRIDTPEVWTGELFADYFQFYLRDEQTDWGEGDFWNDDAYKWMLALSPGAITVGTVRNMGVPVSVELHEGVPPDDLELWDHVTECSIDVPSGKIVIAGCTDYFPEADRIEVQPGTYQARISYGQLDTLSDDGLDGDDRYRVQLWPGPELKARVVKWSLARKSL